MPMKSTTRGTKIYPDRSSNRTRNLVIIAAVAVGFIGLSILLYLNVRPPAPIAGVVQYPRPATGHDDDVEIPFGELPPAGGIHHNAWQNCGIYTQPIETKHVLHSLEHGAVWLTYQPDLPESEVAALQDVVRGQTYLILSPYPQQRSPVVLTAWGLQLEVESASDRRIGQFIDRYRMGPQTPERGASCSNAIGNPIP